MADKLETEALLLQVSQKLNVLISLYLKSAGEEIDFAAKGGRKHGVGDVARYLANMGLNSKDVAEITGSPLASIRTLLTPGRKK
jgi:hypothetical protein